MILTEGSVLTNIKKQIGNKRMPIGGPMAQLNNETGFVIVEKYSDQRPLPTWTTVTMSELKTNDIFRLGGRRGRVFKVLSEPTEGPIAEGVWQVSVEEIVFEEK